LDWEQNTAAMKWRCMIVQVLGTASLWLGFVVAAQANTLVDLGYANGLVLRGPEASQTVYFPLPANTQGATLTLNFTASAALNPSSSVTVLADGVPLATVPDNAPNGTAQITIPPRFTQGLFLQLSFAADQTIGNAAACYNDNVAANWTIIAPATALMPDSAGPPGVGDLWRTASTPLTIALPAQPALPDIETALVLSTALVERGIAPYFTTEQANASIVIDPKAATLAAEPRPGQTAPQLVVPNQGAARALVSAADAMRGAASSPVSGILAPNAAPGVNRVTFGALGVPASTIAVGRDAQLPLPLPLSGLPAGHHLTAILLNGRGMALPQGESEIVSLEIGGNVIWSRAFSGVVALDDERVELPQALLGSGAKAVLHFVRLGQASTCPHFTPLNFTLQDNTALEFIQGAPGPTRFAGFSTAAGGLVPVLTDLPPASLPPALPLLAELLGAAGANPLAISVTGTQDKLSRPFILVSHQSQNILSAAPLPQLTGSIVLPLPNQEGQVTFPGQGEGSVLQLVSAGTGAARVPGLWLSPGTPASLAQAALPGDGNVALYDGSSAPATFLTELHGAVFQAERPGLLNRLIDNWNVELLAVFWLLLTILIVLVAVRARRSK
jgi:hypothetical protein